MLLFRYMNGGESPQRSFRYTSFGRAVSWLSVVFALLLMSFDSQGQTVDICERTDQIKTVILAALPAGTNCESVTSSQLAGITRIDARGNNIQSLEPQDFNGLTSLEVLRLNNNSLASLPEKLFNGLTSLRQLSLGSNSLTSLPEDLFDGLTSLEALHLHYNSLTSLPKNLFSELTSLEHLSLAHNPLTKPPEDLFEGLTSLRILWLSYTPLTSLPKDLFKGLTRLGHLSLEGNSLTSLHEDLFNGLTGLRFLWLFANSLSSLHEDLFNELTSLEHLSIASNSLTRLPEDLFNGLTSLQHLSLAKNSLTSLPEDLFNGLTRLDELWLYDNSLTSLPANLFDHVRPPQKLSVRLGSNPIDCLPAAIVNNSAVIITPTFDVCGIVTATLLLSHASIRESGESTAVTATLDQPSSEVTTISVSTEPQSPATSSDYELSTNTTLTIATGETTSTGTVAITAVDNDRDEPNKTITVSGAATSTETVSGPADVILTIVDDDEEAPTVTLALSTNPIDEKGGRTMITATLDHVSSAETAVTISATPQSPTTSSDYTLVGNTLMIAAGEISSTGTVTITAVDNDRDEPDKTILVSGAATNTQGITNPLDVMLTITDDDRASITAPKSVAVTEGSSTDLPVALSAQPATDVLVTIHGHAGTDLIPNPLELIFTGVNWSVPQTVTVMAAEDEDLVNDQVALALTASGGGYVGVTHSVAVTITDDDVVAITAPASVVVPEGGSSFLPIALSTQPVGEVTLTITGHAGTNLLPTPPTLTFTMTNWGAPQTVTLTAAEDEDFIDDSVALTLTALGGGYAGETHLIAVTITDNDVAAIIAPTSLVIPEGSFGNLPIALSAQPAAEVTLTIAGYAATDLSPSPPVLVFTPTDWSAPQTVTLTAAEDNDILNDQITLTLTASGGGYVGETHLAAVTITDNDVAAVIAPVSVVVPEGGAIGLPVALSAQPVADVTLKITGHVATDLTPTPPVLTFTANNWSVPQTVTLTAAEDEDATNDEVTLTLTASGGGFGGLTHSAAVTITDNDLEPLSVSIYDLARGEDEKTGRLRVELNRPSDEVVIVQYATSDGTAERGSDYTESRGIVVFSRNATGGMIAVGIVDDEIPEAEERLSVTLSQPKNAVIDRGVGELTILDNDSGVTLHIEDEVVEAAQGVIRFRLYLSQPSSQLVSVAYRTEDGTAKAGEDYRTSSGVVQFAPGTVAATIVVPLLRDALDWREETFVVRLERSTHARIAKAMAVATIRNADSATQNVLAAYAARFARALSVQIVDGLQERVRSGADASVCGAGDRVDLTRLWHAASLWRPSLGELLGGCHFSKGMVAPDGAFRIWGRGAFRQFHGQGEGALSLRAEVATGLFGVDYAWNGRWLAGLLFGHSRGEGTFAVQEDSGELQSRLTGVYPYVAYRSQSRGIWGTGGYGRGQAEALDLEGDLGSGLGALGFWGRLGAAQSIQFNYYGDGVYANAVVKRQDVRAEAYRLRLGLEADLQIREEVRSYVRASVRQDGGSVETGLGLELEAGIRVTVPAWRLKGDLQTQRLVMHTAEGFTEWGVSGSVQFGETSTGWMLRMHPSWGPNLERTLSNYQTVLDVFPVGQRSQRTEIELGYGVAMRQGTARPVLGMTTLSRRMMLRLGGELRPRDQFTLSVFGLMHAHETALGGIGLNVHGSLQY